MRGGGSLALHSLRPACLEKMHLLPHILVIDDDETILSLVEDAFSSEYQVCTANDALEGVGLLLSEPIDCLIVDLGMPVLDGVELIQKMRHSSRFHDTPVIVISAFPNLSARLAGARVQLILPKPFAIAELARAVATCIHAERRRMAA